jgi:CHAT domain-containing protein
LPWEFLYDRVRNRFLCLSERTPIVRFPEVPDPFRPLNISRPLKILVVISSPADHSALDNEQEWELLLAALEPLIQRNAVEIQRLTKVTLASLRRALRQDDWNVLHFVGHGGFDPSIGDGVLVFEDEQRRSRIISGQDLGILLHDHDSLRLVVLNACEGARADQGDPFSGSAQGLMQQGIPAVVAMQFEISDRAAVTLASEMYSAICDGYSLEAAVTAARKAIFTDGNQIEWATPVLYLRTDNGMIFNIRDIR